MASLVEALRDAFARGCHVPPRHHHTIKTRGQRDATLLLMPSWQDASEGEAYMGIKIVNVFPGNASKGLPGLTSCYLLFDCATGRQLATLDGNTITGRRTVAASALAASYLAREDASRLLLVGAGRVASLIPEAYRAVRPIDQIRVWNTSAANAERLVRQLTDSGIDAAVAGDLETEARQADIISCATLATEPLIKGAWLQPGVHLDLIGAFTPRMREADSEAVAISRVFVDVEEAFHEGGDIVQAIGDKAFSEADCQGTLADLCRGIRQGRTDPEQRTLFKAVGSALSDLAAAAMVYEATAHTIR